MQALSFATLSHTHIHQHYYIHDHHHPIHEPMQPLVRWSLPPKGAPPLLLLLVGKQCHTFLLLVCTTAVTYPEGNNG